MRCDFSRLETGSSFIEGEETENLFQSESQALRSLDEVNAFYGFVWIMPEALTGFGGLLQKASSLIVADGLHIHASAFCQYTDSQAIAHLPSLTPYYGTGFRVR